MNQTTHGQIDAVRTFCSSLDATIVRCAHVEDWGPLADFTIQVTPVQADSHTTQRLMGLVKRTLPKGMLMRACSPPGASYRAAAVGDEPHPVVSRSHTFWTFELDCQSLGRIAVPLSDETALSFETVAVSGETTAAHEADFLY